MPPMPPPVSALAYRPRKYFEQKNRTPQQTQTWQKQEEKKKTNLNITRRKHFRVIRKHTRVICKQATDARVMLCFGSLTHHSPDDREHKSHVKVGVVKNLHFSVFDLFEIHDM